jgi:hypothetical protein
MTASQPRDDRAIAEAMLRLLGGAARSISPTDVALAIDPAGAAAGWPHLLPRVRRIAAALARDGRIDILRHGRPVDPAAARGVIRLRLAATGAES